MTDHDKLFKQLLTSFFPDFIKLFLPKAADYLDFDSLVFLDKEIFSDVAKGETYEADLVVQARYKDSDTYFLIHTETQAKQESDFPRRMFRYFARLYENHGLPIYPIAVLSFERPLESQPASHEVKFPDMKVLEFRYRVIQLNKLSYGKYIRSRSPIAAALVGTMKVARRAYPKVKLDCMRLLSDLELDPVRTRLISQFIDTYFRLTDKQEAEYRRKLAKLPNSEQEAVMDIVTSWEKKGIEQGLQQGRQEGRQEEALKIIEQQLRCKYGDEAGQLLKTVNSLSLEQLELLSNELVVRNTVNELIQWLSTID